MRLIDAGVAEDDIMMISIAVQVMKFVFPFLISNYLRSTKEMSYLLNIVSIK